MPGLFLDAEGSLDPKKALRFVVEKSVGLLVIMIVIVGSATSVLLAYFCLRLMWVSLLAFEVFLK